MNSYSKTLGRYLTDEEEARVKQKMIDRFGKPSNKMTKQEILMSLSEVSQELYERTGDTKYKTVERFCESSLAGNSDEKALQDAYTDKPIERNLS